MATLQQFRQGMHEAWETLVDGWRLIHERARGALTRFRPLAARTEGENNHALRSAGWGLLAAEVFDADDKVVLRMETPGLERSDLTLEVASGGLLVRGEKRMEREHTTGRYHVTECAYGCFERVLPLPEDVEADQAQASYTSGVLKVELPKAASRRRRTIKVDVH